MKSKINEKNGKLLNGKVDNDTPDKSIFKTKIFKRITIIFIAILATVLIVHIFLNPYRGSVSWSEQHISFDQTFSREEAIEDLEYILKQYKSVDNKFIDGIPSEFKKQYDYEIKNLPENPTMLEVWQAASRIVGTLEIGHDAVYTWVEEDKYFDVSYSVDDDIAYIMLHNKQYELLSINGVDIYDMITNAEELFAYENNYYKDYLIERNLQSTSGIALLTGKYSDQCYVTYKDGEDVFDIKLEDKVPLDGISYNQDFISYNIDKEAKVAIFKLDSCKYNKHYKEVLKEFFKEVKENNISNIAIDLRENGGGSSLVVNEFVKYLNVDKIDDFTTYCRYKLIHGSVPFNSTKGNKREDLVYDGNIYVLTGVGTYSSAMWFSVVLQDNGLAEVIGEPCGNKPTSYGDVVTFITPNTKLFFTCSISYFERPSEELRGEEYQIPDYWVDEEKAIEKLYEIVEK